MVAGFDVSKNHMTRDPERKHKNSNKMVQSSQTSKTPKKKQQSTLRLIKESLKFKSSSKNSSKPSNNNIDKSESASMFKDTLKRSSISNKPRNLEKRSSAQRVSLFKYSNVQVVNCSAPLSPVQIRKDSVSSGSTSTSRNYDINSSLSVKSTSTVTMKSISLVSHGVMEVYQILTPTKDPNETPQMMNYFSLGRNGKIVHPILPRLQVTRLHGYEASYSVLFYNPTRYWRIDFLPVENLVEKNQLNSILADFESVISSICEFSKESEYTIHNDSRYLQKQIIEPKLLTPVTNNEPNRLFENLKHTDAIISAANINNIHTSNNEKDKTITKTTYSDYNYNHIFLHRGTQTKEVINEIETISIPSPIETVKPIPSTEDVDDQDDLNYLLFEEEEQPQKDLKIYDDISRVNSISERILYDNNSFYSSTTDYFEQDAEINQAFKRAIRNFGPNRNLKEKIYEHSNHSVATKRFSSYQVGSLAYPEVNTQRGSKTYQFRTLSLYLPNDKGAPTNYFQ
ncbi:hypothetical protein Kpol_1018p13 [Vanderwaltozyma polyspora DSM 70294]|uniref:Inheritance of peroxisomes protein 1 n=1 Tax=Vanderwaltozyma polyspora (strain ATCC 22028 / DSM 70294 / BCRC 21397 / CBS 2163 / NBRC 10782 / NRRL Y-8283 / UCD 57-17) TaxID=436907 RepID=A7TDL5_VANPO|nr:uncharacterized protein Kpol_1018p13 [Vanderwaltozyma polyspora DSM 70294]EDO19485.1 hypothetical protein Kpol_1018p13 [Vanderwaltozyma polyspora DSM 70294]